MRLTVASVFLATLVAAHPGALETSHAKRHSELARNLAAPAVEIDARWDGFDHINLERDQDGDDDGVEVFDVDDPDVDNSDLFGSLDEDWESTYVPSVTMNETEREHIRRTFADPDDPEFAHVKRGVAWTNEVPKAWPQLAKQKIYGIYTWTEWKPVEADKYKIRFFPMLKSNKREKIDKWVKSVKPHYGKDYMMAPNEVNLASQSQMTPAQAAALIKKYMFPLLSTKAGDGKYKLVSPSWANGQSAFTWCEKFRKDHPDVWSKVSVLNLHYYGKDVNLIIAYMEEFYKRFGKPIWLSEFGCHSFTKQPHSCTQGQANDMVKKIAAYCHKNKYCKAYFIYGSFVNSRVGVSKVNALFSSSNGGLSGLGKIYLSS